MNFVEVNICFEKIFNFLCPKMHFHGGGILKKIEKQIKFFNFLSPCTDNGGRGPSSAFGTRFLLLNPGITDQDISKTAREQEHVHKIFVIYYIYYDELLLFDFIPPQIEQLISPTQYNW